MALFEVPVRQDVSRRVLHVDMDAFYASIEQRDDPSLRKRALVIAHDPRAFGNKGVVTTANYVARQFGVHSAMPAAEALRLVPKRLLTFKAPDFTKYRAVSAQIHGLFQQVTELIEPVALDEAYLDVTANTDFASSIDLAVWLQRRIKEETGLTASLGLSYNKFLAKEASEYNKPDGRTVILPEQAQAFLDRLAIEDFRGVGQKTAAKLMAKGITDGATLRAWSQSDLIAAFGKMGYLLYQHVRGIDNRPVTKRSAKSIGKERTYRAILTKDGEVEGELKQLAELVEGALKRKQKHGKTVVLKVRDSDFNTLTRRVTLERYVQDAALVYHTAWTLWQQVRPADLAIRLLGITVTGLDDQQFENVDLPL